MQVTALVDEMSNGTVVAKTILSKQNFPLGIAWYNGSLYVATLEAVSRYDNVDQYALSGQVCCSLHATVRGLSPHGCVVSIFVSGGHRESLSCKCHVIVQPRTNNMGKTSQ